MSEGTKENMPNQIPVIEGQWRGRETYPVDGYIQLLERELSRVTGGNFLNGKKILASGLGGAGEGFLVLETAGVHKVKYGGDVSVMIPDEAKFIRLAEEYKERYGVGYIVMPDSSMRPVTNKMDTEGEKGMIEGLIAKAEGVMKEFLTINAAFGPDYYTLNTPSSFLLNALFQILGIIDQTAYIDPYFILNQSEGYLQSRYMKMLSNMGNWSPQALVELKNRAINTAVTYGLHLKVGRPVARIARGLMGWEDSIDPISAKMFTSYHGVKHLYPGSPLVVVTGGRHVYGPAFTSPASLKNPVEEIAFLNEMKNNGCEHSMFFYTGSTSSSDSRQTHILDVVTEFCLKHTNVAVVAVNNFEMDFSARKLPPNLLLTVPFNLREMMHMFDFAMSNTGASTSKLGELYQVIQASLKTNDEQQYNADLIMQNSGLAIPAVDMKDFSVEIMEQMYENLLSLKGSEKLIKRNPGLLDRSTMDLHQKSELARKAPELAALVSMWKFLQPKRPLPTFPNIREM